MNTSWVTCFFTTPEYLRTFRGRFLYSFQVRGRLRLAEDFLVLDGFGPETLLLPRYAIRSAQLRQFAWLVQLGLWYIELEYEADGYPVVVWLTPTYFLTLPVWHTNGVVRQWHERLSGWLGTAPEG
jgi:hypothetical protein